MQKAAHIDLSMTVRSSVILSISLPFLKNIPESHITLKRHIDFEMERLNYRVNKSYKVLNSIPLTCNQQISVYLARLYVF